MQYLLINWNSHSRGRRGRRNSVWVAHPWDMCFPLTPSGLLTSHLSVKPLLYTSSRGQMVPQAMTSPLLKDLFTLLKSKQKVNHLLLQQEDAAQCPRCPSKPWLSLVHASDRYEIHPQQPRLSGLLQTQLDSPAHLVHASIRCPHDVPGKFYRACHSFSE